MQQQSKRDNFARYLLVNNNRNKKKLSLPFKIGVLVVIELASIACMIGLVFLFRFFDIVRPEGLQHFTKLVIGFGIVGFLAGSIVCLWTWHLWLEEEKIIRNDRWTTLDVYIDHYLCILHETSAIQRFITTNDKYIRLAGQKHLIQKYLSQFNLFLENNSIKVLKEEQHRVSIMNSKVNNTHYLIYDGKIIATVNNGTITIKKEV